MDVSVEKKEGIHCDLGIRLPAAEVESEITKRLKNLAKTAKIDGFRKGKVPVSFLRKRHGNEVRSEVLNEMISNRYQQAIQEQNLNAAGVEVELTHDKSGEDVIFTAHVELFPEVSVQGIEDVEVEKPVAPLGDAEVDRMVEQLRYQFATWHQVTDRAPEAGDQVTIDFEGTIDEENFEGGSASDYQVVLGQGQMLEEFEQAIMQMQPDEQKTVDITFPEDYANDQVAGKTTSFSVTLKEVQIPEIPELDAELIKQFGVSSGDENEFYEEITANMRRELDKAVNEQLKNQIIEGLKKHNEVEIPRALVNQEIERSKKDLLSRMGQQTEGVDLSSLPDDLFRSSAEDRVKTGLLVNGLIEQEGIEATDDKIAEKVERLTEVYENPQEVRSQLYNDQKEMENIRSSVIEDALVEWALQRVTVTEKDVDFFDLVQSQQRQG